MVAGPPGLAARWITTRRLAPHLVGLGRRDALAPLLGRGARGYQLDAVARPERTPRGGSAVSSTATGRLVSCTPVRGQAVHGDRHGEREQRESVHPVRDRHRPGGRPASGSLRYIHSASSTWSTARPSTMVASSDLGGTGSAPNRLNE